MLNIFVNAFENCKNFLINKKKVAVAVSGGIDSLSLILLANEWCKQYDIEVIGITVDHKLRPTSTDEALYINDLLSTKFNIKHYVLTWNTEKPMSNIEAKAREERYRLMFEFCKNNNIDTILLGHHLQDQVENFFIRLFRGSGIKGLSSIKKVSSRNNITLIRPFLDLKKDDLKEYLLKNNIKWIEDESNNDEKFLRNKVRKFLNTFDNKDEILNRINQTIETIQSANNIIENEVKKLENIVYFYNEEYNFFKINIDKFLNLSKELQYRIINLIIGKILNFETSIRFEKFELFISKIQYFDCFKKYTLNLCIFEKINNEEFVCYREYNSIKDKTNYLKKGELNKYLKYLKKQNIKKYNQIKNFKGCMKEILYTIPIVDYDKIDKQKY